MTSQPATGSTPGMRVRRVLRSDLTWDLLLALLTAGWAVIFVRLFAPGRVNIDIANQYAQAIGKIPVSDWHPPIMSAVWRVLIDITGDPGSLLVLQVGLIAASCLAIGIIVHRIGAPRWVSLLGPAVMATPWTLSQMTTLWKDTQMGAALLGAVVLLIIVRLVPKTWALWIPALALLVYAVGLRKNAVFAVVPIAVYLGWCAVTLLRGWRNRQQKQSPDEEKTVDGVADAEAPDHSGLPLDSARQRTRFRGLLSIGAATLAVLVLVAAGVKGTDAVISTRVDVAATGQISQIFLDDVMFSVPDAELQAADAPAELKDKISSSRGECLKMGEIWDAYWNCYGRGESGQPFTPIAYQDELRDLWLNNVITHPVRYLEYRTAVFSYYFFTSRVEYWPAKWHGAADDVGLERGSDKADYIFQPYVEDFALGTFPMLFKPWFWTLLAVVLLVIAFRLRRTAAPVFEVGETRADRSTRSTSLVPETVMLATSALCYVAGYFPIVPANHFRYTFWPALAVTVGLVLTLGMWSARRRIARVRSASPEADDLE